MNNNNFNDMQFNKITDETINQQQTMRNQNMTNMYFQPQSKKKNIVKILITISVIVIVVIAGIIFFPKLFGNKDKQNITETLTKSTSFWIKNNEGLYAIFDINGKQLTGFDFTSVSSQFVNGTAKVKNQNDEYGLISSTGEMIVEFGKYDYISEQYAVYEMIDKDHNKFLYNNSGKFVRQLDSDKNENVESFIGEYTYALIESDVDYKVIDYKGKEITSFAIPDDDVDSPKANSIDNYVSIFYNNINYIIDISKSKVLLTVSDSRHFCIGDVNEENSEEFILSTCNYSYEDVKNDGFKLIRNGKIAYSKESDGYAKMKFEGNNVVYEDDDTYLLDENGNEKTKANSYIIYKDYKNYIKEADGILNGAELYVNGILKEKLDCNNIQGGYAKHGVYLLDHCSGFGNGNKIFINADGTRINDKAYQRAYEFDENGYASVSEDDKNFYLINLKGEKVSDYYSNDNSAEKIYYIKGTENLYCGSNEDGTRTIFEVDGEKILTGKFNRYFTNTTSGGVFVILEQDNKYIVYNVMTGKPIVNLDSEPYMSEDYFTTSENSKTQYYSYITGKLFYEE